MKIIGLISGGKDSIFNLLCCKSLGYQIVVLGNLISSENEIEIDSYMYQSVGKELLPLISECLEIPLIQKKITGKAINIDMKYKNTNGDEVEDLFELLLLIKNKYPEVQGISCGAIMSNYQRNRLEDVAHRLNLQCFCFMWMLPENTLLKSIVNSNIKCIIVKIASFGLNKEYIGKLINNCLESLINIENKLCIDFHSCGEGGEYETLTLDGPHILFKNKYISIEDYEEICLDSNPYSPVYVLKPIKYKIKNKKLPYKDCDIKILPFLNNDDCLNYYLTDTGRYLLMNYNISENYNKEGDNRNIFSINDYIADKLDLLELIDKEKFSVIKFIIKMSTLEELVNKMTNILEKLYNKEWLFTCKTISLDLLISYSKFKKDYLPDYLHFLNNIWKDINICNNFKWNPIINIEYIENDTNLDYLFFHISINKCSDKNIYKHVNEYSSSSVSSYGTSIPKSFSNNIIISKKNNIISLNKFQFNDESVKYPSIIISSSIYGLVPHLQSIPNKEQIDKFLEKNAINEESIFNIELCIELSLAIRSYRCNLNSLIYNSQLIAFNNEVKFRYDIFNITHIWIIQIADKNILLEKLSEYFRLLIYEYNNINANNSSEWSTTHKFIESSLYNPIEPIIIPMVVNYLPYNSRCKIIPISFLIRNYEDFGINLSNKPYKFWDYNLRYISSEKEIIFGLFTFKENIEIYHNIEYIFDELKFIIDDEFNKYKLSLKDNAIYSRIFVINEYYSSIKNCSDDLIKTSFVIPVKKLFNSSKLQYLILLAS